MNMEDIYKMDERELKRECAFALCPPGQTTASSFCDTLDGVMRQVREWCARNSRGCNRIGFRLEWDGQDDRKCPHSASVGHEEGPPMGEAFGENFHVALTRAALCAALALADEERNKS